MKPIDLFYLNQPEPERAVFIILRDVILSLDEHITQEWKYKLPFFCYKGKMFCYLWKNKKTREPYIGVVEGNRINHPKLEQGNRSRMKILSVNPNKDIDIETIDSILNEALDFYRKGIIKVKDKKGR